MARFRLCIDLKNDPEAANAHARQAMERDARHPLPAVLVLGYRLEDDARRRVVVREVMRQDCLNHLIRWLGGVGESEFLPDWYSLPDRAGHGV